MILHRYLCNLCQREIESNFQGDIDGRSFRYIESSPGVSDMQPCEPRNADVHVCAKCWRLVKQVDEPRPSRVVEDAAAVEQRFAIPPGSLKDSWSHKLEMPAEDLNAIVAGQLVAAKADSEAGPL